MFQISLKFSILLFLVFSFKSSIFADYEGRLFDTHVHVADGNKEWVKLYKETIKPHDIKKVVALNQFINPDNPDNKIAKFTKRYGGSNKFRLLFDIDDNNVTDMTKQNLNQVLKRSSGLFYGMGENAFYREPLTTHHLTDELWMNVFNWANKKEQIVMIHLRAFDNQLSELEIILQTFPNAKILLHGPEYFNDPAHSELIRLLQQYPNLYYTLDTATLLIIKGDSGPDEILMFPPEGNNAQVGYHSHDGDDDLCNEEDPLPDFCDDEGDQPIIDDLDHQTADTFIIKYNTNKDAMMQNALSVWASIIAAAPDRVMWGTDMAMDWHLRSDVVAVLAEFSREFIGQLPIDQQENFAWDNAKKLFKNK